MNANDRAFSTVFTCEDGTWRVKTAFAGGNPEEMVRAIEEAIRETQRERVVEVRPGVHINTASGSTLVVEGTCSISPSLSLKLPLG